MREHFRGVLWPAGEVAPGRYQYRIAGLIITDTPIDVGSSMGYLDGDTHTPDFGRGELQGTLLPALKKLQVYEPPHRYGDASDAMLTMQVCDPGVDKKLAHDVCVPRSAKPPR